MTERVIWKYELKQETTLSMPKGAKVLDIQYQQGCVQLWAVVDPALPQEERTFLAIGTGHTFDDDGLLRYIKTVQIAEGEYVFHFYERIAL